MSDALTIGDFSLMTHLSIKTLRYYHQVGLLEPAEVDSSTGYRYYRVEQIPTAQIIQRFRDLNMPVDEVKEVLAAPDLDTRNALITAHLSRLEGELEQTRQAVTSLRDLLGDMFTAKTSTGILVDEFCTGGAMMFDADNRRAAAGKQPFDRNTRHSSSRSAIRCQPRFQANR